MPPPPAPVEGRLLAFPHGDAESLLGREVVSTGQGYRIADERKPGCEVLVRTTETQYRAVREVKTRDLASLDVSYTRLAALETKFGAESQALLEVDNTEVLDADLRGPCGKAVITRLFVGRGKRRVFAGSHREAATAAATPVGEIAPRAASSAEAVDEVAWTEPQAYAFDVRELTPAEDEPPLALDVRLPSIVTEGEEVRVTFESAVPVWLVVYYVDADNKADVLWPSNEEPSPSAAPGSPAILPSAAEQRAGIRIRPTLPHAARGGAKEQLVVYAFTDRRDYELVKPASGVSSADGAAFAEALAGKLAHVPARRWSRKVLGYSIAPKKAPAR